MTVKIEFRTARKPHKCENCQWDGSVRGAATIAPGHRYLLHTAFPGDEYLQIDVPMSMNECIACAINRSYGEDLMAGACGSFCCGDVPCARPVHHAGDHSCKRDAAEVAR